MRLISNFSGNYIFRENYQWVAIDRFRTYMNYKLCKSNDWKKID